MDYQFCIHASKSQVIIINQLESIDNSPFEDSHSQDHSHLFCDDC